MKQKTPYRVVIQGVQGAFHEIAARHYFHKNTLEIIPASTFGELIHTAEDIEKADIGIMAIENSIAGSILSNYGLVHESKLQITGEVYLRIKQNLMTLPGTNIANVKEVFSHHMAIAQCRKYFKKYPHIKLIESEDTALSAKMIQEKNMSHAGAIASTLAAEMYNLNIIGEGIEDNTSNATRFLILDDKQQLDNSKTDTQTTGNKTSICFTLTHEVGRLHIILRLLADHNANITKIQSVPIVDKQWQYRFFLDFINSEVLNYDKLITELNQSTDNLTVLGRYNKGKHYDH